MLSHTALHRHLVEISYSGQVAEDEDMPLLATEQHRISAMRILGWIASLQMNEVTPRYVS